jgi:hypothetical protein
MLDGSGSGSNEYGSETMIAGNALLQIIHQIQFENIFHVNPDLYGMVRYG